MDPVAIANSSESRSLEWAHPLVREWFVNKFGTPTEPQEMGWPHILGAERYADLRADRVRQDFGRIPCVH